MSSEEEEEPCPGCEVQIPNESIYKCYSCGYVGCEDCGFNEDGECGVCCSEEKAWEKYTDGILSGWAENYIRVNVESKENYTNQIRTVKLMDNHSINGILV